MRNTWVIALVCVVISFAGQAQVTIDDRVDETNFFLRDLSYFIDSTNTKSFTEISSKDFVSNFRHQRYYQNKDFQSNVSYWIRFPVRHRTDSEKAWLLEFYDQTIDELDVFVPLPNGGYRKISMGDQIPFSERDFMHKNFEVLLAMDRDTVAHYYFRIRSHAFADIRLALRSANRFVFYGLNEYFLFGMFYGMIVIIALYNFLVFLAIREVKNIYYIMYILSVAAYAMSYDGIGFQYLWPDKPDWNNYAVGVTLYSVILWSLVFTRRFLRTHAQVPLLDKLLFWTIIFRSIWFLAELSLFPELLTFRNIEIIPLSLIFYTGITVWRRGYRPARFFVIAYGILFTGFFVRSLVYFNVLPFNTPLHYSLHFAFMFEMLFLTFALGDRIRILKAMRDRALRRIIQQHEINMVLKDHVNRELEQKVKERTLELNLKNAELEESNQKLEKQSREISQINSMLDLDNWKLKNSIKEVLNERLMDKTMDYAQFKTLYPDALACYRFLETLKWEKNFKCRKCANDRYFDGSSKFARRCTRCGYNESITAFTLFHSIKFPVEKAFYLAYLTVSGKKDYTLEALAEKLDLRVNTIWAFRHKVAERISELEKSGHQPHVSRWEEVILIPVAARPVSRPPLSSARKA